MERFLLAAAAAVLLPIGLAAGADPVFFPLAPCNQWTYSTADGKGSFTIRVGSTPLITDGQVWHKVWGYAHVPVLMRQSTAGNLYQLDEETGRERLLTSFEVVNGGHFASGLSMCEQEGQPQQQRLPFELPQGVVAAGLEIRYRSFDCADAGVENEVYAENLGLLSRTVQSIAGPRRYELVSARLGALTFTRSSGVDVSIDLPHGARIPRDNQNQPQWITGVLRASVRSAPALQLRFPSSQRFDAEILNADGTVVWRFSDGEMYSPWLNELRVDREYSIEFEFPAHQLADGEYTLQAWFTNGNGRSLSSSTPFTLTTASLP